MAMIILISYLLFYVAVPYIVYRVVWHWTNSAVVAWAAAIVAIPAGIALYARMFERWKHRSRLPTGC